MRDARKQLQASCSYLQESNGEYVRATGLKKQITVAVCFAFPPWWKHLEVNRQCSENHGKIENGRVRGRVCTGSLSVSRAMSFFH